MAPRVQIERGSKGPIRIPLMTVDLLENGKRSPARRTWRLLIPSESIMARTLFTGRTSGRRLKHWHERRELVRQLDVPTNRVTEYPERKGAIRGDTALRATSSARAFRLNCKSLYELRVGRRRREIHRGADPEASQQHSIEMNGRDTLCACTELTLLLRR